MARCTASSWCTTAAWRASCASSSSSRRKHSPRWCARSAPRSSTARPASTSRWAKNARGRTGSPRGQYTSCGARPPHRLATSASSPPCIRTSLPSCVCRHRTPAPLPGSFFMRVLFVTPECAPLTKTGGLGDVAAALPAALRAQGNDVRVLLPRYREIDPAGAEERARVRLLGMEARVLEKGDCLLVDVPELYDRDGGPYQDAAGADWSDNALRFGVLSRAAALLASGASPLPWRPEILHCNDWPTALAPVYLHFERARAAALMTVHNLGYQGIFDA